MTLLERKDIEISDTWDLSPIYKDMATWESEYAQVEQELPQIKSFQGHLDQSSENLEACLRLSLNISRKLEKLHTYAHLKSDEDTSNSQNLGVLNRAKSLYARFAAEASFISPELIAIDSTRLAEFLKSPSLSDLVRYIKDIVRYKPHTLSFQEEALLAQGMEVFDTAENVFSQLENADLDFGTVEHSGKEYTVTHSTYSELLKNPSRELRQKVYDRYYHGFDTHKHTFATTLAGSVKRDIYLSSVRKYPSALDSSLFDDNATSAVYDNLLNSVNTHLPALHRYYALRSSLLKISPLRLFDTYVPLVQNVKLEHSYEDAVRLICEALKPLGDDYVSVLRKGITTDRWVDKYENKGKRSGAYSSGCFDSYPYILMSFKKESLNDVFTLAHEAGHSMHSHYSRSHQSYQDHSYRIFVAEVASILNEQLLVHHLKSVYADNKEVIAYLINHQLDEIKGTLFRQTMFAEFERIIHSRAEAYEALTLDVFRDDYKKLLVKYFGPAVTIAETDDLECLRIPHFYWSFYVYKYATGISAAIALSRKIIANDPDATKNYLSFLCGGCSKYPLELLKDAGVDLTSAKPIESALEQFESLVNEFEQTVN